MTIERATELGARAVVHADVCVVGSGAAGITIARRLDGSALRVVVLEAGTLERDPTNEADDFEVRHVGRPYRSDMDARGRWFGGSTNLWFGRIAIPDPIDFEPRPWVPHSGWPIGYDEAARWFGAAADVLALQHPAKLHVESWPRDETLAAFDGGSTRLGVWLWAKGMHMGVAARRQLTRSANVRVLLGATATEIASEASASSVSSIRAAHAGGSVEVVAGTYVLAMGGLENPRLLLASRARWPEGVGNGHDVVGRYYLDHPNCEGMARVDLRPLDEAARRRVTLLGDRKRRRFGLAQLRVVFAPELQRDEELLNHSSYFHDPSAVELSAGYASARNVRNALAARQGLSSPTLRQDLVAAVRAGPALGAHAVRTVAQRVRPVELVVVDQLEQEPDPASRVFLDDGRRDRFGTPRLVVDWRLDDAVMRSHRRMHEVLADTFRSAGITTFHSDLLAGAEPELVDMRHPSGTTRMAASPRAGVVDEHCRVHGVDNLYVAGSSVFPTAGHFNPTMLIVALAARLAAHLERCSTAPVRVA